MLDVERYNREADRAERRALSARDAELIWRQDIARILRADWRDALVLRAKYGPRLARKMLNKPLRFNV